MASTPPRFSSKSKEKNPCGRDCPKRTAVCKRTCPDWQEYETKHMAELQERIEEYEKEADYWDHYRRQLDISKKKGRIT